MVTRNLHDAKRLKKDEWYTLYEDIESEVGNYDLRGKTILCPCDDYEKSNFARYFQDNFERLGLKKLICTCKGSDQISMFGDNREGKILVLGKERKTGSIDGDFRSEALAKLKSEADVIVTNPPFSLFREFIGWAKEKPFLVIGSQNAITYKEVFPLIREGLVRTGHNTGMEFIVPAEYRDRLPHRIVNGKTLVRLGSSCWFTNLESEKKSEPLHLMTMEENLRSNQKLINKCKREGWVRDGKPYYPRYDNYEAIEVPFAEAIPLDFEGVMGVPVTAIDKLEGFKIVGLAAGNSKASRLYYEAVYTPHPNDRGGCGVINGGRVYARILISPGEGLSKAQW